MKRRTLVGLIVGGYLLAVVAAVGAVAIYMAVTSGPSRDASAGMFAFGDTLVFLAVFGVACIPPTAIALAALRSKPKFWVALSVVAIVVAISGVAAAVDYVVAQNASPDSLAQTWSVIAILRLFASPIFGGLFLVASRFAPTRSARTILLVAALAEAMSFGAAAFMLFGAQPD